MAVDMLFQSYIFVFLFLPVSLTGFYFIGNRWGGMAAKLWLIVMSLWFYGSFRIEYVFLLLLSIAFNYGMAGKLRKRKRNSGAAAGMESGNGNNAECCKEAELGKRTAKRILAAGIAGNLALLFFFKYMNFFIGNWNAMGGRELSLLHIALPVGISFFTFHQISYLVDCFRGEVDGGHLVDYMLSVVYFPKLVEGPLVMPSEFLPRLAGVGGKKPDGERMMRASCLFILGMLKKVILADTFGGAVDYGYANLDIMHGWDGLLLIIFYTLQLYFDFSGYCDMARGVSGMFGIELPLNFNSPYKARNIVDFWKRWHITLNQFFTKYLYIPLGGNRKGKARTYCNLLLVFLVSGIWHGAGWNFILWGLLHGGLYVLTRMWQGRRENQALRGMAKAFGVFLTFCFVACAWVYFRAESVAQGNQLFRLIFANDFVRVNRNLAGYFNLDEFWYILKVLRLDRWEFGHYILMAVFTAFSLLLVFLGKNAAEIGEKIKPRVWTAVLFALLLLWCVLTFSNVSTFLYVNF
ncbi:peptidoglycan O-acetyltransferase [Lachnospiraceae bacterium]|nr:peptidoglycan O-acetyltransferase [Lachnospiraceae bacterium]